jgi:O-antigen/teichoic acid export membrane protein
LLFVPVSFIFIPNSVLTIFLKGDIINFRGLLNIFVFSFIPAALNSIFYSILIAISKERQYLLYFIFSFVAAILLGFFINTFIFMPLFLEFILAAILFYKLYIRSRYENINRSMISSFV